MTTSSPEREPLDPRLLVGALSLYVGVAIWVLILIDSSVGLPLDLPRTWYLHRPLWGVLGAALFGMGWVLQRTRTAQPAGWKPDVPGRRFQRLVVYSKEGCHLCDDAKAVLANYLDYLPEIEEVDIAGDTGLEARYGMAIPVVELDGREYFRGRVDEVLLRRLIEGTPPVERA